ncbi:MAG TPA: hypothetical protein VGM32_04225 [Rhodopila sp.]
MSAEAETSMLIEAPCRPDLGSMGTVQVLAAWRAQPGAFLVLGFTTAAIPPSGVARGRSGTATPGVFRCMSWPGRRADDGGHHAFLIAIRLLDGGDAPAGETLLLRGATGGGLVLPLPAEPGDDEAFGLQVARIAGSQAAPVGRFMLDMLRTPADRHPPHIGITLARMLRAFLTEAAETDGCIEIMIRIPEGAVMLQGWGARLSGAVHVLLAGTTLPWFPAHAGEFDRSDIAPPAVGVMLAMPPDAAMALGDLDHVFVISERGVHSRALVEHRLLGPTDSIGHIRHMLPALRCPPPMSALIGEILRPRYEGRDTLSESRHPVRAAIDFAATGQGAGAYLAGWISDPQRRLARLHLCGSCGYKARIDEAWVRVTRPDVTDAFGNAPGFAPPADHDAGFSVAVAEAPAAGESLYLQFTFVDGDRAFLPIAACGLEDHGVRVCMLASVDMFKPSGLPILERHVAPLMGRLPNARDPDGQVFLRGPLGRNHAIVTPLAAGQLPRTFVSGMLRDPPESAEQVVFVCGPDWNLSQLEALQRMIRFHDLPASVLRAPDVIGPAAALRIAAGATQAGFFQLTVPAVSGPPGWRQALRAAVTAGTAFACPTLLYEDWSIRYAGSGALCFQEVAPFTRLHAPLAGMPAMLADGSAPVPARIGTLECCAIPRATLAAVPGSAILVTDAASEADFFARLGASGLTGIWVPSVRVYAPEGSTEPRPGGAECIVDGWVLRQKWHAKKTRIGGPV